MLYEGTDLKFAINIECEGFSMRSNDFHIVLSNGCKSITILKEDMVRDENNVWYLCFNSRKLGAGTVTMVVYANVPDDDFEDGERTEVYKCTLCHIEGV